MTIILSTDMAGREPAYRPRHRAKRWDRVSSGRLRETTRGKSAPAQASRPEPRQYPERLAEPDSLSPALTHQFGCSQLRCLLETCAKNQHADAAPGIAYLVSHPSHTTASLTAAWERFRASTRDAEALRSGARSWWEFFGEVDLGAAPEHNAMRIKSNLADDAWELIINGRQ
jgi:hypothetical protein